MKSCLDLMKYLLLLVAAVGSAYPAYSQNDQQKRR